ncbi:MAG TPA: diacylglycerol kinase family protein [Longimicrobiales bacterium]|nr:diacylglycerol kinase family protein [Longimicrobiales bacterium]
MTQHIIEGATGPYAGRTFVLLNPAAGQDDLNRLVREIGGAFAARGADFDLRQTEHPGHAAELARHAADMGYRAVCVVGGDGTLAEAVTGLAGTRTPLAVVPRGTANQVALNLGIPLDVEEAIEVAVNGTPRALDIGRIGGRSFALVAGAGLDAAVMATATRELKERWGFGAYIYAAVKEALNAAPVRFRITRDGQLLEVDAVTVLVANVGELFTGFLPIRFPLAPRPTSSWNDGLLDVVVVAPRKLPEFAAVLWNAAHKRFGVDPSLLHFQAEEITIDSDEAVPVQVDGDPSGTTPVTASVARSALRIFVPQTS